jgi:hypothetical protein
LRTSLQFMVSHLSSSTKLRMNFLLWFLRARIRRRFLKIQLSSPSNNHLTCWIRWKNSALRS